MPDDPTAAEPSASVSNLSSWQSLTRMHISHQLQDTSQVTQSLISQQQDVLQLQSSARSSSSFDTRQSLQTTKDIHNPPPCKRLNTSALVQGRPARRRRSAAPSCSMFICGSALPADDTVQCAELGPVPLTGISADSVQHVAWRSRSDGAGPRVCWRGYVCMCRA